MYNGLPLLDRTAVEVLADPTRPQVAPPRDRYVYYPDSGRGARGGGGQHPQPQLHDRGRGRRSTPEDAPACSSRTAHASAGTPCTSRTAS